MNYMLLPVVFCHSLSVCFFCINRKKRLHIRSLSMTLRSQRASVVRCPSPVPGIHQKLSYR